MVIGEGALQPLGVRQVATPLPWFPPKPIAIFIIEGMTATQRASAKTLSGIPLSGVAMISFSTLVALLIRFTTSESALFSEESLLVCAAPQVTLENANSKALMVIRHFEALERVFIVVNPFWRAYTGTRSMRPLPLEC